MEQYPSGQGSQHQDQLQGSPGSPVNGAGLNGDVNQADQQFPDISNFLSQPKMSVKRILKHTVTVKLIASKHPQIVNYIQTNINDILTIIFSNHERLAAQAYTVFGHLQSDLINAILNDSNLNTQVADVLQNKTSSTRILSRACNLTALTLTMCPGEFPPLCDYVQDFYRYIEEDPIMDFFEEITQEDISYIPIQEWLAAIDFPQTIINEINTIEINPQNDVFNDKPLQKLRNLFKLIQFSKTSPALIDLFRSADILKVIMKYEHLPIELEDARWSALDALYSQESAETMIGLFDHVFKCISEPYVQIHRYRVTALQILRQMVQYDKTLVPRFKKPQIYQILLRTILQFRENSFALLAVEEFLGEVFKNKQLNVLYAQALIPPLMFEGIKRENISMNAFSFKVIESALSVAAKDREFKMALLKIEEFDAFVTNELRKRRQIMKEGYGGKLPVVWA